MANDLNNCNIVGRLTKNLELRYTTNGTPVGSFTLASNRKINNEDKASFFEMVLWGKLAESLSNYLVKGKQVIVTARAEQQTWIDKNSGGNRSKIVFNVTDIQMLGSKENNGYPKQNYNNQNYNNQNPSYNNNQNNGYNNQNPSYISQNNGYNSKNSNYNSPNNNFNNNPQSGGPEDFADDIPF